MDTVEKEKLKVDLTSDLIQMLSEVIGADVVEELDVNMDSSFTKDLEMDSIEIVAFAEKVKAKYGDDIDFVSWLSGMDLDQVIALKFGDVINFIADAKCKD